MKNKIVIYHKGCVDGFAAAFAAWLKFRRDAEYIPLNYGDKIPDLTGKEVYIVDFSFPRQALLLLVQQAKSILVLDHHKTAQEDLQGLDFVRFDLDKSGCVLAWEYFHPEEDLPELFKYIQDRDLWTWKLSRSKEFNAGLKAEPMNFAHWEDMLSWSNWTFMRNGIAILDYQKREIERIVERFDELPWETVGGYDVPCFNLTTLISETGNTLCQVFPDLPFVVMYFDTKNKRVFSLRSVGDFDVSAVAKLYGGGGHRNAAGFSVEKSERLF